MSQILEDAVQAGDPQRVAELARNDAEREAEERWVKADLRYLATQRERDADRLQETVELERGYHARTGWLL